jgi:hypothetical protein
VRFHNDVDLVALAGIACRQSRVPDVFEEYCRRVAPAALPNVLTGLSRLVAEGILTVHEPAETLEAGAVVR